MPQNHNRNNAKVSISASNKGRRMFRGRGGPKDGHNIPPPSSTKRRTKPEINKYNCDPPFPLAGNIPMDQNPLPTKQDVLPRIHTEGGGSSIISNDDESNAKNQNLTNNPLPSNVLLSSSDDSDDDICIDEKSNTQVPPCLSCEKDDKWMAEIKHIQKRILNIQESIKLSKLALCNPQNWENNCLNAISNCVGEWKAIVSFHTSNSHDDENYNNMMQQISLQIFGLVQMGMQSGPLTGCKPGYMKRCGSDIAAIVHKFLLRTVSGDSITELKFSEKQSQAIAKWILNAEKAIASDRPPTKSSLKLQKGKNKKITSKDKKKHYNTAKKNAR